MKYILCIYLLLYLFGVFIARVRLVRQKTGVMPVTYGKTDSAHDFVGWVFKGLVLISTAGVAVYLISDRAYRYLAPIPLLEHGGIQAVGLGALWVSLVWTILAQTQMGKDWRIGIDQEHPTGLVQHGLFRFSRNPIYVGVIATSIGLFLTLPNVLNLVVLVVTLVAMSVQVRLEEEHLKEDHKEKYSEYRRRTRRWL